MLIKFSAYNHIHQILLGNKVFLADFNCDWLEKLVELEDNELSDLELKFEIYRDGKTIELIENGGEVAVNRGNLENYLEKYCEVRFGDCFGSVKILRDGINWYYGMGGDYSILDGFQPADLRVLLSGEKSFAKQTFISKIKRERTNFLENSMNLSEIEVKSKSDTR